MFDPDFSENSYGFRPGRSAQQAVGQARRYAGSDRRWVVDMDLEKFFDRVNHDVLMLRVARKVRDKRVPQADRPIPACRHDDLRGCSGCWINGFADACGT